MTHIFHCGFLALIMFFTVGMDELLTKCGQLGTYGIAAGCIDDSKEVISSVGQGCVKLSEEEIGLAKIDVYDNRLPEAFRQSCEKVEELYNLTSMEDYELDTLEFREAEGSEEGPGVALDKVAEAEAACRMQ